MATPAKIQILNKDQALKLAEAVGKTATKTASSIQTLCLTGVAYANVHGDVTVATRLMTSLGKTAGIRRQAVVNLMEATGCLKWEKDAFIHVRREDVERDPAKLVAFFGRPENFWAAFTPEAPVVTSVDALEMVQRLIKRIAALQKGGATVVNEGVYEKLTAIAAE